MEELLNTFNYPMFTTTNGEKVLLRNIYTTYRQECNNSYVRFYGLCEMVNHSNSHYLVRDRLGGRINQSLGCNYLDTNTSLRDYIIRNSHTYSQQNYARNLIRMIWITKLLHYCE